MSAPTEKQLAAGQRRSLRSMRVKLLNMAGEWDGIDQFNVTTLTDLADKCEEAAAMQVDDGQVAKQSRHLGELA